MDSAQAVPWLAADYYRKQAARVRELAAGTKMPDLKEHLYDVARQYDALWERANEIGTTPANSLAAKPGP
jgi:hypothetical protein